MMKILKAMLLSVALLLVSPAHADPLDSCKIELTYGAPQISKANTTDVCHTAYVLKHDDIAKIPVWTAYILTPEHAEGCFPRTNKFAPDKSLPVGKRSELDDYRNSGYDKGHIANDADMSWSEVTERESFLLSNMAPQLHGLNAGIWKDLESDTRDWAFLTKHTLQIYAGSIYDVSKDKKIGNGVVVPDKFWKIVIDTQSKDTLAFIFPHVKDSTGNLKDYQVSVAEVEKQTGIKFNVPTDKSKISPIWKVDLKSFQQDKAARCKH